jgi:hypothetical protein
MHAGVILREIPGGGAGLRLSPLPNPAALP